MKKLIPVLLLAIPLFANANPDKDEKHPQQGKMAACNKAAGEKKGDERKAFMKECLKKDADTAADKKAEKAAK
jgi:hypothetical protein